MNCVINRLTTWSDGGEGEEVISAHRRASTGGRSLPTRDLRQGHSCSQRSRRRQSGSQRSSGPPRQTRICAASVGICDIPELEAAFTARGVPLQIKLLSLVFLLLFFFLGQPSPAAAASAGGGAADVWQLSLERGCWRWSCSDAALS